MVLLYTTTKFMIDIKQAQAAIVRTMPEDIKTLARLFTESGFELYLVGGCVRDSLLGKTPKDWDVCTNAMPEAIIRVLTAAGIDHQVMGVRFAIVFAKMTEQIEIATFREDEYRNHDVQSFIQYIQEKKPVNYEERLRIFTDLSNKQGD